MSLNGIKCPYGSECQYNNNNNNNNNDDNNKYITTNDLYKLVEILNDSTNNNNNNDDDEIKYEYIHDFDNWLTEQKKLSTIDVKKYTDSDYDLFIISTTKACPTCGFRSTHFHSHQCHHIRYYCYSSSSYYSYYYYYYHYHYHYHYRYHYQYHYHYHYHYYYYYYLISLLNYQPCKLSFKRWLSLMSCRLLLQMFINI